VGSSEINLNLEYHSDI